MVFNLYSIYDRVAGLYSEPFCAVNVELAIRKFDYLMLNSPMVANDCELYLLGSFTSSAGGIAGVSQPEFIKKFEVKK